MEIHHPHTERKRLRHYLFEFLMLFLAVSAGFFVENIREHLVEKKRAFSLAGSLVKDMQKDTAQFAWLRNFGQSKLSRLDSLYDLLGKPFKQIPSRVFYHLIKEVQISFAFAPANGTVNQLKNAGYLRYFSNDSLPSFLAEYDFLYKDVEGSDGIITDLIYNKYYDLLFKYLDPDLLHISMANREIPDSIGILPIPADGLKELKGIITMIRRSYQSYSQVFEEMTIKAVQIIEYLKRKVLD